MKYPIITVTFLLLTLLPFTINSQISEGGLPYSFFLNNDRKEMLSRGLSAKKLTKPNISALREEDKLNDNQGLPYRVGTLIEANINTKNSGKWTEIPGIGYFWQCIIKAPGAKALSLIFDKKVTLPEKSRLYIFNENKKHIVGGFTSRTDGFKTTEIIEGESIIIEYFIPHDRKEPLLEIGGLGYVYRGFNDYLSPYIDNDHTTLRSSQSCQVDVACSPENNGWENQINSVVRYTFVDGQYMYVCSGATVNNTAEDCTPYFLSAWHCGEPEAGDNLSNYVFYWNYQKNTCQPNNNHISIPKGSNTMTGGLVKASSANGTLNNPPASYQVAGADFYLLEFNNEIPESYNPYFAGWDNSGDAPNSGVGIHHPAGSSKKISTYTSSLTSSSFNGGAPGHFWEVYWSGTQNGHGVTEGGSSGSALFNENKLIVGQLTGGSSFCNDQQPGGQNASDVYGKLSSDWDEHGAAPEAQLKPWLDPQNTGVTSLAGRVGVCDPSFPEAEFEADQTNIFEGNTVSLSDLSTGNPSSWSWSISPSNGWSFASGNSSSENPQVTFNQAGQYTVSLTVSNVNGSDSETKTNYIIVTEESNAGLLDNSSLENLFYLYPNPTSDIIELEVFDKTIEVFSVQVVDAFGKPVSHSYQIDNENKIKIDLSNLAKGIYFLNIQTGVGVLSKKVIKK